MPNTRELEDKLNSLTVLITNINNIPQLRFSRLSPDQQAEFLELQTVVNEFLTDIQSSSKSMLRWGETLRKISGSRPTVLENETFRTELLSFLRELQTILNRDLLAEKESLTAESVPNVLPQLVKQYEDYKNSKEIEASRWRALFDEQIRRYNQAIINNIDQRAQSDQKVYPSIYPKYQANLETFAYIAHKCADHAAKRQNQDIAPASLYNQIVAEISAATQSLQPEISATAQKSLLLLQVSKESATPQDFTPEEKQVVKKYIVDAIAESQRQAKFLTASETEKGTAAYEMAFLGGMVVSPVIARGMSEGKIDADKFSEETQSLAEVGNLSRDQRDFITKQLNSFQQDVQLGFIRDQARLEWRQKQFFDEVEKKTGLSKNQLPPFIKNTVELLPFKAEELPKDKVFNEEQKAQIISDLQKRRNITEASLLRNATPTDVLTKDIFEYRQQRLGHITSQAIPFGFDELAITSILVLHPYLTREMVIEILNSTQMSPAVAGGFLLPHTRDEAVQIYKDLIEKAIKTKEQLPSYRREIQTAVPQKPKFIDYGPVPGELSSAQLPFEVLQQMQYGGFPAQLGPAGGPGFPAGPGGGAFTNLLNTASRLSQAGNAARTATAVARPLLSQPWFWALLIGIVVALFFLGLFPTTFNIPAAFIPQFKKATVLVNDLAAGTCPIPESEGPHIQLGTYDNGGHGTDAYWGRLIDPTDPNKYKAKFPIPDAGLYPGCMDPATCQYYGLAIDVQNSRNGVGPVVVPYLCDKELGCNDEDMKWTVFRIRQGRSGDAAYLESNANGRHWQIILIHLDSAPNVGDTFVARKPSTDGSTTSDQVGTLFNQAGNVHVHFEVTMDGIPIDPTPYCDGSGGGFDQITAGDFTPPAEGWCSVAYLQQFWGDAAAGAACVCVHESGGRSSALSGKSCLRTPPNNTMEYSVGLFQINLLAHDAAGVDCNQAFDPPYASNQCTLVNQDILNQCVNYYVNPDNNATYAYSLYQSSGWSPWVYSSAACGLTSIQ